MTGYETIRYKRTENVGTLTLARPEKRNAQNPRMWQEMAELGSELLADQTLRCLVVAADGPSFSAGIDLVEGMAGLLVELTEHDPQDALDAGLKLAGTFHWISKLGCPSVAAVRGHAYGAGMQLALACDFRILGRGAQLGLIETRYGLLPDMGATVRLPRIVGESRARELILLGEIVDSAEALRIGLASRVVPDDEVESAASELASRLVAQPPLAIRGARSALDAAWYQNPEDSFKVAVEAQIRCLQSEDFRDALAAAAEGRSPRWRGC
jgi:enoyl-CoA hydratase/carnithine racemase